MIELFWPYVPKDAIEAVTDTLRTRWIGEGPKVTQFEKKFAEYFDLRQEHVVALNSGTSALETAYDLIGLKEGDEVITTPLTCTATNLPLLRRGCKIVWADIKKETLCIDLSDVLKKVTDKTKAVVQVHLGGLNAGIESIPNRGLRNIPVVSDACQALGIFIGDYTCNSFQAIKQITTGDGGMLFCPTPEEAKKAKLLRWFGIDREKKIANRWQAYKERRMTFDIELPGTKRQTTDIAAAMGMVGLEHLQEIMSHINKTFAIYKRRLSTVDGITLIDNEGAYNMHWLATVLVERRDEFARKLFEANIDTNMVQVRNDIYKIFGGKREELPVLNEIEEKYISIPIGMHVSFDEANYICETIESGW